MRPIDMETWPRREIFDFYDGPDPFYSVSFRVDVTGIHRYARARGLSFYMALCWAVGQAVNRVENFRYVIRKGRVWLLDARRVSFTDIREDTHLFYMVTLPLQDDIDAFCRSAREKSRRQEAFVNLEEEGDDLIYLSCLPDVDLTGITTSRAVHSEDSIPRFTWGRFMDDGRGREVLTMTLEANHRLVDGWHVGQFAKEMDAINVRLGLLAQ